MILSISFIGHLERFKDIVSQRSITYLARLSTLSLSLSLSLSISDEMNANLNQNLHHQEEEARVSEGVVG